MEIKSVGNTTDVFGSIIQGCDSILEQSQHLAQSYAIFCVFIQNKTDGVAENMWGFIEGTIHTTSRPVYHQRVVFTQFKKCHGLKFKSVLVPDGFIACLYGPVPAKTHDAKLL